MLEINDLMINRGSTVTKAEVFSIMEEYEADSPESKLESFFDIATDTIDETLTPAGVGELEGCLLKLDPEENEQGVFIIAEDGTETRAEKYIRNMPANVIFLIPKGWPPAVML